MKRRGGRQAEELRPVEIQRNFTGSAEGSILIQAGRTSVLCTASVEESVPPWKEGDEPTGWVTAEYSMLPGSTSPRKRRERGRTDNRSTEIGRLIGRSLRAIVDFAALGPRTVVVDCDVLQADGGTRTAAITGGFIALVEALHTIADRLPNKGSVLQASVAAVSVGLVDGELLLDLDYEEDSQADVDMNVVMTGGGDFVEVQGTAEQRPFSRSVLGQQLDLAGEGIARLTALQRDVLGEKWPLDSSGANC